MNSRLGSLEKSWNFNGKVGEWSKGDDQGAKFDGGTHSPTVTLTGCLLACRFRMDVTSHWNELIASDSD